MIKYLCFLTFVSAAFLSWPGNGMCGTQSREEILVACLPMASAGYYDFVVEGSGTNDITNEGRLFAPYIHGIATSTTPPATVGPSVDGYIVNPASDNSRFKQLFVDYLYAYKIASSGGGAVLDPSGRTAVANIKVYNKLWMKGPGCSSDKAKYVWPLSDVAEMFPASLGCKPADLVVCGKNGILFPCRKAYDTRVVGIMSGRPAITLARVTVGQDKVPDNRYKPVALRGQVLCNVVDRGGPIEPGTLLTSSSVPGCAMRADPERLKTTPGALVGKALQHHVKKGKAKIRVLLFKG